MAYQRYFVWTADMKRLAPLSPDKKIKIAIFYDLFLKSNKITSSFRWIAPSRVVVLDTTVAARALRILTY